ncbi:MAG: substrate-binding domain-containing protein [Planctomycetes bacterium]|nr:substrate-binding domain-containing protein [Planctomycetota bacterium]
MRQSLKVRDVAERIRALLDAEAPHGGGMVSCRGIAKRVGATYSTVRRAFRLLAEEGRLRLEHGRGTFVASGATLAPAAATLAKPEPPPFKVWTLISHGGIASGSGCYASIHTGALKEAMRADEALMVVGERDEPADLVRASASGILLMGAFWPETQRKCASSPLPVVVVDDVPLVRGMDHVVTDNRRGADLIVQRLLALGHRRFAVIRSMIRRSESRTDLHPDADSEERARFVRMALRRRGLDLPDKNVIDNYGGRARKREFAAQHFLTLKPRPTAVICSGEDRAVTLLRILRQEGIAVPGDVSIAAFCTPGGDDGVTISGVEVDFEEMGRLGVERLRARADGRVLRGAARRIQVPVALVDGETWGPAPRD